MGTRGSPGGAPAVRVGLALLSIMHALAVAGCYHTLEDHALAPRPHAGTPPESDAGAPTPAADGGMAPDDAPTHPELPAADGGSNRGSDAPLAPIHVEPQPNLRVAFLGDQGVGANARAVLKLIAREHAAMVVHAGDLSYGQSDPLTWEVQINNALGSDFPYVAAIGNHDTSDWEGPKGFIEVLHARLLRTPGLDCYGDLGVQSVCRYRGLEVILSGVGVTGTDHSWYLERALTRPDAAVRLCVWHKNQHDMQVGSKKDEAGWGPYQLCQRHGAPIITGHEHSYSRTFTLTALGDREHEHGKIGVPEIVTLAPGSTFVAVTGIGGRDTRARTPDHVADTWWASIYANEYQMQNGVETGFEPSIRPGALFIDFHVDGDPHKARAYFKTIADDVVDQFELQFAPR